MSTIPETMFCPGLMPETRVGCAMLPEVKVRERQIASEVMVIRCSVANWLARCAASSTRMPCRAARCAARLSAPVGKPPPAVSPWIPLRPTMGLTGPEIGSPAGMSSGTLAPLSRRVAASRRFKSRSSASNASNSCSSVSISTGPVSLNKARISARRAAISRRRFSNIMCSSYFVLICG